MKKLSLILLVVTLVGGVAGVLLIGRGGSAPPAGPPVEIVIPPGASFDAVVDTPGLGAWLEHHGSSKPTAGSKEPIGRFGRDPTPSSPALPGPRSCMT